VATAQGHQLVDVGPYAIDVVKAGRGSPALILEAGLGDSLSDWDPVFKQLAALSTVVAYSRPSAAPSGGPENYGVSTAVRDLHALLAKLDIKPPYILVARSFGGIIARLYTSTYPADVAGIVLIDGTHEQQVKRWGTIDPKYPEQFRLYFDSVARSMPRGAQAAEVRETMRIQAAGAVEGLRPLPNIPIAVLTSMKVTPNPPYVNGTARGHELWRQMHVEWFLRSTNGIHIETTKSGHAIQHDEPQLVVDAVQFVLHRIRE
jgi:pimeloyl-ACP methyl ester carboxylesterase